MNTAIVTAHGFTGKYNGLIMATSKAIALVLSGFSIVSAMVAMAQAIHATLQSIIEYAIGGLLLAVLIEGITLICLSLIRQQYLKAYRSDDDQMKKRCWTLIWWLVPFAGLGILLSAAAGDLFWHQVLAAQAPIVDYSVSIGFALVVSITFLIGELFALLIDQNMQEEMGKGRELRKVALANEHADNQLILMREAYRELLADQTERDAIKQRLRSKLKTSLLTGIEQINIDDMQPESGPILLEQVADADEDYDIAPEEENVNFLSSNTLHSEVAPDNKKPARKRQATFQNVSKEFTRILDKGERPTQTAIARKLGVSRQAVAPHFNTITEQLRIS